MEEHVTTAETHAEGHLQPSDEHLADAEEHLKLVKAHLAALEPAGQAETHPVEAVPPMVQEVSTVEAEAVPLPPRKVPTKEAKVASPPREVDMSSQQVSGGSASSSERVRRVWEAIGDPEKARGQKPRPLPVLSHELQG